MNLGDLEFKPKDFSALEDDHNEPEIIEIANRILREKLAKALSVWTETDTEGDRGDWKEERMPWHTHRARLVCIEEIKE